MSVTRRFFLFQIPGLAFGAAAIWIPSLFAAGLAYHGLILLLAIADALLGRAAERVRVERHVDSKLSLDEEAVVRLRIVNRGPRAIELFLVDSVPEVFKIGDLRLHVSLSPFQEATAQYTVIPTRRGSFAFGDIWIRSTCLLGLAARKERVAAAQDVRVYPNVEGIRRAQLLGRRNLLAQIGIHRLRFKGQGSEFEQLREYTRDDDYKWINWKATARRGKPITTDFQVERAQNILLCLDASYMMGSVAGRLTKLDHAVNAAALLAHVAITSGDRVGVLVFSQRVLGYAAPSHGARQMSRIIDALYAVQPEETRVDYRAFIHYVSVHCKRRSMLAIFTDLIDMHQGEELLQILRAIRGKHLPVCMTFRDTNVEKLARTWAPNLRSVFTQAMALDLARQRTQVLRDLTQQGAHVLDSLPEELSVQSVNKYLELKGRQLL